MNHPILALLFFLLASNVLVAQQGGTGQLDENINHKNAKSYNVGLLLGMSSYEGDLHCFDDENLGIFSQSSFSFGIGIQKIVSPQIGIGLNYRHIKIGGDDGEFSMGNGHNDRGFSFSNTIHEVNLRLDYTPFAKYNWLVQPYVFGGVGLGFGGSDTDYNESSIPSALMNRVNTDKADASSSTFAMPVGLGIKTLVADNITIALEGGIRFMTNDYLDGVSMSGNSEVNDYYGMGGVSIQYGF